MTRYFYDTEFLENGETIELISIGIVCEDGREYYAVNRDMPHKRIARSVWLMANVVPSLPRLHGDARLHYAGKRSNPLALDWTHPHMKRRARIADEVREFLLAAPNVELWADYAAYDHVVLCQLWGPMVRLPAGLPMFTNDIQQEATRLGLCDADLPHQDEGLHNALADARATRDRFEFLRARREA